MICLDTNVVIGLLRRGQADLRARFEREMMHDTIGLSVVALFELRYGIAKSTRPGESAAQLEDFLQLPVPIIAFDAEDALEAGMIRAALENVGTPIGPVDTLIAAQARRRDARLVTANVGEFSRVIGLRVEDWSGS